VSERTALELIALPAYSKDWAILPSPDGHTLTLAWGTPARSKNLTVQTVGAGHSLSSSKPTACPLAAPDFPGLTPVTLPRSFLRRGFRSKEHPIIDPLRFAFALNFLGDSPASQMTLTPTDPIRRRHALEDAAGALEYFAYNLGRPRNPAQPAAGQVFELAGAVWREQLLSFAGNFEPDAVALNLNEHPGPEASLRWARGPPPCT